MSINLRRTFLNWYFLTLSWCLFQTISLKYQLVVKTKIDHSGRAVAYSHARLLFKGESQTTVRYRVRVNREENHTPNFHLSERWGGKWSKSSRDKPMSANSRFDRDARIFLVWRFAFQSETDFAMPSKTLTKLSVVIAPKGAGRVFGANAMVMILKC